MDFSNSSSYSEKDCVEFEDKLYYLEKEFLLMILMKNNGAEVLGSGCDGIQFKSEWR